MTQTWPVKKNWGKMSLKFVLGIIISFMLIIHSRPENLKNVQAKKLVNSNELKKLFS